MGGQNSTHLSIGRLLGATLAAAALIGCASDQGTRIESRDIGGGKALLTTADVRVITALPKDTGSLPGRNNPREIVCMEPSPDIARAVSSNFGLGASLGLGGLPSGVTADAALSFARARAEAVAQMTERLATIQLLRDGLYRACEAYANGAISDTTYAVMVSRYDDTMITLLLGELAAGNFGKKLATLGSGGGAGSDALIQKAVGDKKKADEAQSELDKADTELAGKEQAVGAAQERLSKATPGTSEHSTADAQLTAAKAERDAAKTRRDALKDTSESLLHTAASSSATAFGQAAGDGAAGANLGAQDRAALAAHLGKMQRKYIENINSDALMVACVAALDRPQFGNKQHLDTEFAKLGQAYKNLMAAQTSAIKVGKKGHELTTATEAARNGVVTEAVALANKAWGASLTPFGAYCLSGVIPEMMLGQQRILEIILTRKEADIESIKYINAIDSLKNLDGKLRDLKGQ